MDAVAAAASGLTVVDDPKDADFAIVRAETASAILTNVQDKAAAILANFGADDAAVLDVILGKARAKGRLPMELPRSMEAVEAQKPGVPDDSVDPLYPSGAGLILP